MYQVKSNVDIIFSEYKERTHLDVLSEFTLEDFAFWFLDDGCTIERRDYIRKDGKVRYRYFLCIGSLCPTVESEETFLSIVSDKFSNLDLKTIGRVTKNNSKATENNKTWVLPVAVGRELVKAASKLGVTGFENKLRIS